MIIIHKPTGELMNEVEFIDSVGAADSPYRHILFDISHEGFEGSDFALVEMPDQPVFDSRYQKVYPVNVAEIDGVYSGDWDLQVIDFGDDKKKRKELIEEKRYEIEIGGVELEGSLIPTDRHTQSVMTARRIKAREDPGYSFRYKSPLGFITLNADQTILISNAVHDHVQAAFDREDELIVRIENGEAITPLDW